MLTDFNPLYLLNALVYAILGIIIFVVSFTILDKMTPFSLWKELIEDQNTALGVMIGLLGLGICVIIAAAVH